MTVITYCSTSLHSHVHPLLQVINLKFSGWIGMKVRDLCMFSSSCWSEHFHIIELINDLATIILCWFPCMFPTHLVSHSQCHSIWFFCQFSKSLAYIHRTALLNIFAPTPESKPLNPLFNCSVWRSHDVFFPDLPCTLLYLSRAAILGLKINCIRARSVKAAIE